MTAYPHRYGDTDRARQHYATACVASAAVLRRRIPRAGRRPEAAARHARSDPEQPDPTADQDSAVRLDDDEQAPRWWR